MGCEDTEEAEKTLRDLISAHPDRGELLTQLGEVLREQGRFVDAAQVFAQAGEFEITAWSYYEGGQFRAAQAAVSQSPRTITSVLLRAILLYVVDQDVEAAQAMVGQLQPSELLAEMPAGVAFRVARYRRDPDRIFEIARGVSQDYLDSKSFHGPRCLMNGVAYELAGRPSVAEKEWRAGLAIIQARLQTAPDDERLLLGCAWHHAALHENAEAERAFARYQAAVGLAGETMTLENFDVLLRLRKTEAVLAGAAALLQAQPPQWELLHVDMRFSPEWDFLRGDSRFEKLLREHLPPGAKPLRGAETKAKL